MSKPANIRNAAADPKTLVSPQQNFESDEVKNPAVQELFRFELLNFLQNPVFLWSLLLNTTHFLC